MRRAQHAAGGRQGAPARDHPRQELHRLRGGDVDATRQARSYFTGYAPSSPSIGLLRDGKLVHMVERWQIEGRTADAIAADLAKAFDTYCAPAAR